MKLVLIGGGDYGNAPDKPYNLKEIDEKIVSLSNKPHPRLLFIGFNIKIICIIYCNIKLRLFTINITFMREGLNMDKLISKLVGLGVPAVVLVIAMGTTGLSGAA